MTMTIRTQRRLLWTAACLLGLACAAVGTALPAWPLASFEAEEGPDAGGAAAAETVERRPLPPLSTYAVVYGRDLQRPLVDPTPRTPERKPPPPPPVALVGTIVESQGTRALLKTKAGRIKMASVGERVDEAEVVEVGATSATIRFAGHTYTLNIEKGPQGS